MTREELSQTKRQSKHDSTALQCLKRWMIGQAWVLRVIQDAPMGIIILVEVYIGTIYATIRPDSNEWEIGKRKRDTSGAEWHRV
jgi:hypothetical protein